MTMRKAAMTICAILFGLAVAYSIAKILWTAADILITVRVAQACGR